jgi:hypothetical protein
MAEEQEENMRKIKLEYDKLEEEKRIWAHEKRRIDVERESLTSDYHRLIQEKNFYSEGARKEFEKQEIIKKNFEIQIDCLRREVFD